MNSPSLSGRFIRRVGTANNYQSFGGDLEAVSAIAVAAAAAVVVPFVSGVLDLVLSAATCRRQEMSKWIKDRRGGGGRGRRLWSWSDVLLIGGQGGIWCWNEKERD